ncbi:hypothetical protein PgNI_10627 [Pyricularia grisea]|uniref:NAD(P)-binding protein n=1 Tax=Pyricularia grisea TaxID=148305 RepID=A0A6P8AZ60_PYRGI|nr:hypothetical protein PgNI_10627 [Pyricularia grisea]TLD07673.1 hypothetical protein PgNI_10627 [Pyricularia grisea]
MASWHHKQHMPNLQGRVAFVTGGNAGIGYHTVVFLAKAGAKVYFGARSASRAEAAVERMYRENPGLLHGQVNWLQVDMASMKSVLAGCDKFRASESKLNILIHNAAHEGREPSNMADSGVQITMQTNHLAVFAMTQELQPMLRTAAAEKDSDVRIVNVSSNAPSLTHSDEWRPDFSDPHGGDIRYPAGQADGFLAAMKRYSVSKMAMNLLTAELQARYDREGVPIMVISVCPGAVWTPGTRRVLPWYLLPVSYVNSCSEIEGPKAVLFAAVANEVREQEMYFKGQFINRTHLVIKGHPVTYNHAAGQQLWSVSKELVREFKDKARPE